MLHDELLREYCEGFFGYGNPAGKYWFIGLEEAGGRWEVEVQERLKLWKEDFGGEPIIDGFEFDKKREHSQRPFHNPQTASTPATPPLATPFTIREGRATHTTLELRTHLGVLRSPAAPR